MPFTAASSREPVLFGPYATHALRPTYRQRTFASSDCSVHPHVVSTRKGGPCPRGSLRDRSLRAPPPPSAGSLRSRSSASLSSFGDDADVDAELLRQSIQLVVASSLLIIRPRSEERRVG